MNALALSLTPSISSNELFLINGLLWRGEWVLKEQMKTNTGRGGVKPISMLTKSCLVVAKSFIKKAKTFFRYEYVNTYIYV